MFFELEDKTYRIKFYYTGRTTVAELFEVNKGIEVHGDNPMVSLGVYGVASTYHTDQFNKRTGRKVALANLLNALSDPEVDGSPILLNRADREMIWAKYFETHRK